MGDAVKTIQDRLNYLGYDAGPPDGEMGSRTSIAVTLFQNDAGLEPDGIIGRQTLAALFDPNAPRGDADVEDRTKAGTPNVEPSHPSKYWPTQAEVTQYFGAPGSSEANSAKCRLPFEFRIAWETKDRVSSFSCHPKVAKSFEAIFADVAQQYGRSAMQDLGLDLFGGCFNPRRMRGGQTWSMHSYGIAVDLDPDHNTLKMTKNEARFANPEYDPYWDIVERYGCVSLGRVWGKDWMHIQFARLR